MFRRALIIALVAIPLAATTAAAAFTGGSTNPGNTLTASSRFCPLDPTVVLGASADTFVNSAAGGTNYGASSTIDVGPFGVLLTVTQRQGLVRFQMPAIPARCTLTGATLRLFNANVASGRTIQVLRADSAWQEMSVNWNSRPGAAGSAVSVGSASGWQQWGVLTHVQNQYSGQNHGFLIRDSNIVLLSAVQNYRSREASQSAERPQLVLNFGS